MKVTYYLEILSSWCHWAEPAWDELKRRYEGRVAFDWRIALMNPADFPVSNSQCDWFYRRSGSIRRSPYILNSGWFEASLIGDYTAPNLVAEACRELGFTDDTLRRAITHAALREGRQIGRMTEAVAVAAATTGLDAATIESRARSAAVAARVQESTAAFHAHQVTQRPTFILENSIGDKMVLSGIVEPAPLSAAIDAMLADAAAYAAHAAHFGGPPAG
ncbi:MAG TPA: DsbA family protein [Opitutaceae bacterium]